MSRRAAHLSQAKRASIVTGVPGRPDDSGGAPEGHDGPADALDVALGALVRWRGARKGVTIVAIDGHGGSGKSTIAESLCAKTGASLVHTDDFFMPSGQRGLGPSGCEPWRVPAAPAGETGWDLGSFYDVVRLRVEALEPLRAGHQAVFRAFNWGSGFVSSEETRVEPSSLVLLEGVYSGAPELADLVDRAVCVDTPEPERLRRLRDRVAPEDWDEEWLRAEKEYFAGTRSLQSFDLVVRGTGAGFP